MKKMMFLATTAILSLSMGCNKVKNIANINVDIPYSAQVTVPQINGDTVGVPIPGTALSFPAVGVATNSKLYLAQYYTDSSKIISFGLKSLSIQVSMPANQNFDFLDTIQLYISTVSQPEVLVAYQYNIPKGTNSLDFVTVNNVNLKNYFLADTMYFRARAYINAVPASGTQLNIASVFHMVANPLY
ncbi:MAG: hypothetical protein ACHQD8_06730 [Chitinophagales bacterium]